MAAYLALTLVFSCVDNPMPGGISYGFVNATMNGQEWNKLYKNAYQITCGNLAAKSSSVPCSSYVSLASELYNSDLNRRQRFEIINCPIQKGTYRIIPFSNGSCSDSDPPYAVFYSLLSDGDILGDVYNVLNSEDNFLEIASYNPKTQELKGSFKITFLISQPRRSNVLPDTLRFVNGSFHTKIVSRLGR